MYEEARRAGVIFLHTFSSSSPRTRIAFRAVLAFTSVRLKYTKITLVLQSKNDDREEAIINSKSPWTSDGSHFGRYLKIRNGFFFIKWLSIVCLCHIVVIYCFF